MAAHDGIQAIIALTLIAVDIFIAYSAFKTFQLERKAHSDAALSPIYQELVRRKNVIIMSLLATIVLRSLLV